MKQGTVHSINSQSGMVAIETDLEEYTIVELLGSDGIEQGDFLVWRDATGLAKQVYVNLTKRVQIEVFVQNHGVSPSQLPEKLLLGS